MLHFLIIFWHIFQKIDEIVEAGAHCKLKLLLILKAKSLNLFKLYRIPFILRIGSDFEIQRLYCQNDRDVVLELFKLHFLEFV